MTTVASISDWKTQCQKGDPLWNPERKSKETWVADIWDAIYFGKVWEERTGEKKKRHERRKKRYREGMITGYLPWLQHFRRRQFTLASKNGKKRLSAKNAARLRPSRAPKIPRPLLPLYNTKSSPQSLLKLKMADAVWWTCVFSVQLSR